MNLLLDTHTFLWHAEGHSNLSAHAAGLLTDPANDLFVSIASIWEIAIKSGLGKLTLTKPYAQFITDAIAGYGLRVLPITMADCTAYEALPFPTKHRDPYDRMIIVHAMRDSMTIVGADVEFDAYPITRLW